MKTTEEVEMYFGEYAAKLTEQDINFCLTHFHIYKARLDYYNKMEKLFKAELKKEKAIIKQSDINENNLSKMPFDGNVAINSNRYVALHRSMINCIRNYITNTYDTFIPKSLEDRLLPAEYGPETSPEVIRKFRKDYEKTIRQFVITPETIIQDILEVSNASDIQGIQPNYIKYLCHCAAVDIHNNSTRLAVEGTAVIFSNFYAYDAFDNYIIAIVRALAHFGSGSLDVPEDIKKTVMKEDYKSFSTPSLAKVKNITIDKTRRQFVVDFNNANDVHDFIETYTGITL